MRKRLFASLLCLCMVVALLPATALADGVKTTLDIQKGSIEIGEGTVSGYTSGNIHVTVHDPDGYKIIGAGESTANTVTVTGGTHSIILDNVRINASDSAFDICSGATVNLELVGDNILTSGNYAGLQVPAGAAVTIIGEGSLTAIGGAEGCAGIGGAAGNRGGTVDICGGTVTATGGMSGAGIGGGYKGAGGTVNISGGTVTATGDRGGAGIGGGGNGSGGTVKISGGNVKATGSTSSTSVASADIGAGAGGSGGTLTDASGTKNVYRITLVLVGVDADTPIAKLLDPNGNRTAYGMNDVKTLDNKLYFYLPAGTLVNGVATGDTPPVVFAGRDGTDIAVAPGHAGQGTLVGAATINDVTLSGIKGLLMQEQRATIMLTNAAYIDIVVDEDVSNWFTTLPSGLSASITALQADTNSVIVVFSGAPEETCNKLIQALIPAGKVNTDTPIPLAANGSARFSIAASSVPVTIYNDPLQTQATIWLTGVGLHTSDLLHTDRDGQGSACEALMRLADRKNVIAAYDIYLESGRLSTSDPLNLTFDLDKEFGGQSLPAGQPFTLVHQKADATYEYFYNKADQNGDLTFGPLYELSPFMLVKGTLMPESDADIPATGDSSQPLLWLAVALTMSAALVAKQTIRKRRRD